MKVLILINCYNNHKIVHNIYNLFITILDKSNFVIYLINNNILINKNELSKYSKICYLFKGNNNCYEFTGIQKCLEYLKKNNQIELFNITVLITDAILNYPINYLNYVNIETFNYVNDNETCVGNIDSFGKTYIFNDFLLEHWIRTCFIVINNNLFKKINYRFISYNYNDIYNEKHKLKINIDFNLLVILNKRLKMKKYDYLDADEYKINIKKLCIFNEWNFTKKLQKITKIYDIYYIYMLNLLKCNYVDKIENIENLNEMEQIKLRNEKI